MRDHDELRAIGQRRPVPGRLRPAAHLLNPAQARSINALMLVAGTMMVQATFAYSVGFPARVASEAAFWPSFRDMHRSRSGLLA